MKKAFSCYLAGFLTAVLIIGGVSYAASSVRIIIDNKELVPTDANGNRVEAKIIDGTTYLPVRAVANAFGKAVYWDGETSTVYLGEMNGALPYPTVKLSDLTNIGDTWSKTSKLVDNYGNSYSNALGSSMGDVKGAQYLLNGKYSRLKGTIYVREGISRSGTSHFVITADGRDIYTSPAITKTSYPIDVDVSVKGCNELVITITDDSAYDMGVCFGNAGLYQ